MSDWKDGYIKHVETDLANYQDKVQMLEAENARLTAELTALREQVRWIPVSERLPEKDGAYIGWDGTLYVGFTWDERFSVMFPNTVTHWMPLPLPPEGE